MPRMRSRSWRPLAPCLVAALALASAACHRSTPNKSAPAQSISPGPFRPAELRAFASLQPIDTHAHVFVTDPAFVAMLARLNVRLLDICLDDDRSPFLKDLPREIRAARGFIAASRGHAAFCTSFDPFGCRQPGFAAAAIRQINRNFAQGAIAVKIWKNIGMEIEDRRGRYILPDDPAFAPIYRDIARHGKTLVAHLADPDSAWQPLDPRSPDYWYYTHFPEWYMYGKPHPASKAAILRARDRLVAENPQLRVVGAHLGSMEANFPGLARRLDRYPNFAVDMAARMPYVALQPRARAIAFILKYQDRLIYATDLDYPPGANSQAKLRQWEDQYSRDWRFLATDDWVEFDGRKFQGLDLPPAVLRKLYHANAVRWFPGILGSAPRT